MEREELREHIWPLMPVDRCYGEPDIWCSDCQKGLDDTMAAIDQYTAQRVDKELRGLYALKTTEVHHEINERLAEIRATLTNKEEAA